ncbi:hypothetical protein [Sphaerisporangium rufum]|nr:hypothetical protein [Sphaerisporangium rufum]
MAVTKVISRVAAGGLFLWMGYLSLAGPAIEFSGAGVSVRCSPVTYYLGFDYDSDDLYSTDITRLTYRVVAGELKTAGAPGDTHQRVNTYCDRARTGRAALLGFLAVPTAVLSTFALRGRPKANGDVRGPTAA